MSFPDYIPVRIVERYLELNIRQNSEFICEVLYEYTEKGHNYFTIFYNSEEALICIKMYALQLLENYLSRTEEYN